MRLGDIACEVALVKGVRALAGDALDAAGQVRQLQQLARLIGLAVLEIGRSSRLAAPQQLGPLCHPIREPNRNWETLFGILDGRRERVAQLDRSEALQRVRPATN